MSGSERTLALRYEFVGHLDPIARRLLAGRKLTWVQELRLDTTTGVGRLSFAAEAEPDRMYGSAYGHTPGARRSRVRAAGSRATSSCACRLSAALPSAASFPASSVGSTSRLTRSPRRSQVRIDVLRRRLLRSYGSGIRIRGECRPRPSATLRSGCSGSASSGRPSSATVGPNSAASGASASSEKS